jgi:hypothetical protein
MSSLHWAETLVVPKESVVAPVLVVELEQEVTMRSNGQQVLCPIAQVFLIGLLCCL